MCLQEEREALGDPPPLRLKVTIEEEEVARKKAEQPALFDF